jgi:hypothetical protein
MKKIDLTKYLKPNTCLLCRKEVIANTDSCIYYKNVFAHVKCAEDLDISFMDYVDKCESGDASVIPDYFYCYERKSYKDIHLCPYWRKNRNKPLHENGCCLFLDQEDDGKSTSLLWDQVKECGENEREDECLE